MNKKYTFKLTVDVTLLFTLNASMNIFLWNMMKVKNI